MSDLVVGWRILCADCGVNCDLHACYNNGDDECDHHFELCGECIKKREEIIAGDSDGMGVAPDHIFGAMVSTELPEIQTNRTGPRSSGG